MLTKRIAAFLNEIVDTIKHWQPMKLIENFIVRYSVSQKILFNASKSLLKISEFAGLPLSSDDHQQANNFAEFFTSKINAIRLEIENQVYSPYIRDANGTVTDSTFSKFNVPSESKVHGLIISSSKNKSCPLGPIPTKLVIECLDVLLPPITRT